MLLTMRYPLEKGSLGHYIASPAYAALLSEGAVDRHSFTPVLVACAREARITECACDRFIRTITHK